MREAVSNLQMCISKDGSYVKAELTPAAHNGGCEVNKLIDKGSVLHSYSRLPAPRVGAAGGMVCVLARNVDSDTVE